ncbi:16S rRNA (guanine(527)-N(7))-methyltransferase RsmG [Texas Phoenix palm phytoplasma]|uniref:Ribosomal RNA small subunit methyltransferase G n=2 Tax=Texas Phoenix palm phytoplasma TaxID=176709 RepID=A0ABS5BI91_9MOLU|nr:16S rRNA (guanine(527)-N(7))-methyltransferase RsmG [Texas Phoenix palm phytoplasma]
MFEHKILKEKFNLTNEQLEKFRLYYLHLNNFNEKINLTSLILERDVYFKHFYDSLLLTKIIGFDFLKKKSLCDLGTGAGFPSIPLKIFYPKMKIFLIESCLKKIIFLKSLIKILKLSDVFLFNERIEKHKKKYNFVVARALGNFELIFNLASKVTKKKGYFITMKGPSYEKDLEKTKNFFSFRLEKKFHFELPLDLGKRVNLLFQKIK